VSGVDGLSQIVIDTYMHNCTPSPKCGTICMGAHYCIEPKVGRRKRYICTRVVHIEGKSPLLYPRLKLLGSVEEHLHVVFCS